MGNRATVIFTDGKTQFSPAVYLHWNGGPESVYGFLEELDRRKVRADQDYECARFIQLVGEHFDSDRVSGLSLGITNGPASDAVADLGKVQTDHGDNGFYLVNRMAEPMWVRRFRETCRFVGLSRDPQYALVELDAETVAQERREADQHEYRPAFRAFYKKLTAKKKIEAA